MPPCCRGPSPTSQQMEEGGREKERGRRRDCRRGKEEVRGREGAKGKGKEGSGREWDGLGEEERGVGGEARKRETIIFIISIIQTNISKINFNTAVSVTKKNNSSWQLTA